jgi:archaellum component FlaD/FlaE
MAQSTQRKSGRRRREDDEDGRAPREEDRAREDADESQEKAEEEQAKSAQKDQPEDEQKDQQEDQPDDEQEDQPDDEQEDQPEGEAAEDQDEERDEGDEGDDGDENGDSGRRPSPSISAKEMTVAALDALRDLTGQEPEAATGLQWDGDSWLVTVDVLELERIPETTDLLATYVVQLDDDGGLLGYKRTRRFQRSQASEE